MTNPRPYITSALVAAIFFIFAAAATAAPLKKPTVEYSADVVSSAEGYYFVMKTYYAPSGRSRVEMELDEMPGIIIVRDDLDLAWNIYPERRAYMEERLGDGGPGLEDDYELVAVGKETVEGLETTKYEARVTDPGGAVATALLWITDDWIIVREVITPPDESSPLVMELKNLKVGPLDPELFEVPLGYVRQSDAIMPVRPYMSEDETRRGSYDLELATPPPARPAPTAEPDHEDEDEDDPFAD